MSVTAVTHITPAADLLDASGLHRVYAEDALVLAHYVGLGLCHLLDMSRWVSE